MEQKYFKPSLEDIRVGYKLEFHNWSINEAGIAELNYDRWEKTILNNYHVQHFMKYGIRNGVRVPYLTQEQIEKEGWSKDGHDFYKKDHLQLLHSLIIVKENVTHTFLHVYDTRSNSTLYAGICPSINEFRTIMKFLNIK
jgi:hypothetical protein